jgi:5'(3')-deoxyribonucleotidase
MRIGIDVDGVIADNHTAWINRVNHEHVTAFTPADLTCWTFWTDLGITKEQLFKHWTPDIYAEVQPYPGALDAIRRILDQGHRITYVTSCMTPEEWHAKQDWLTRHGFQHDTTHARAVGPCLQWPRTKGAVAEQERLLWLVDDSVQNCEEWPNYAVLMTRAHNKNINTNVKRVRSLDEVAELLRFAEVTPEEVDALFDEEPQPFQTADKAHIPQGIVTAVASPLPSDKQARKDTPVTSGVLDYFSAAIAEVARVSKAGNDQHNPGQPLHWARGKSMDHADCVSRHLMERGMVDEDGQRHSAKLAWRALALLQQELEDEGAPMSRASKVYDAPPL